MIDINYIRENAQKVRFAASNKNLNPQIVDNLLEVDQNRRDLIKKIEHIRAQRNTLDLQLKVTRTNELIEQSKILKGKLQDLEPQLRQVESAFSQLMLQIPNIPLDDVPIGKDSSANIQIRTWGEKPSFDFPAKDHSTLSTALDLIDFERGSKVAGYRGYFLKNELVQLQFALMHYSLQKFLAKGYTLITPPIVTKRQTFVNTGHFPWGEKETYRLSVDETDPDNDYFLAGTAEIPLVSYYSGETLNESDLPIRMVGYSPCYRREIGNYGKDTKGVYRVHEFVKTEQVVLCRNDLQESAHLHEEMLTFTEEIAQDLELPYRILLMCTGDMGEPQAKKYDLEAWMPGRNDWGELGSDSIMLDFQSRRAQIRYRTTLGEIKYVHMLNNTATNSPRWLVAILENYQQKDGSIKIPKVLVPYMGKDVISAKK